MCISGKLYMSNEKQTILPGFIDGKTIPYRFFVIYRNGNKMVTIESFKNKSGQNIQYLQIQKPEYTYPVRVGLKKALVVIDNAEDIKIKLKELKTHDQTGTHPSP